MTADARFVAAPSPSASLSTVSGCSPAGVSGTGAPPPEVVAAAPPPDVVVAAPPPDADAGVVPRDCAVCSAGVAGGAAIAIAAAAC